MEKHAKLWKKTWLLQNITKKRKLFLKLSGKFDGKLTFYDSQTWSQINDSD